MGDELKVALAALEADADVWDQVSQDVYKAKTAVEGLTLTVSELSWAGESSGCVATYQDLQNHIATLLGEGGRNYQDLSVTLDKVRMGYQADDEKAARTFKGVWDLNG